METKIIRSPKRKKTVQAKVIKGFLHVYLPLGLPFKEETRLVELMKNKVERKRLRDKLSSDDYLLKQFNNFNKKYFETKLSVNSIKFVTNQKSVRGSCTPKNKTIRLSHRLSSMPKWVLDYVIMHEMAHLVHPNHSKEFWAKVNEYKYTERARGFLIAKDQEEFGF